MPPAFKAKWFRKLKQHDHGWLIHPTGKQQLLGLHLQGNESYISSGFIVAQEFNFKEATNVILEFIGSDNRFNLHIIENNSDFHSTPNISNEHVHNNVVCNHPNLVPEFCPEISEIELRSISTIDFNQPPSYTWVTKVTPAVARKNWIQALVQSFLIFSIL
jgi:hypothetical protein